MIIGLTGPICAGKDEVAKLLTDIGFRRFSLSDEIRAEMRAKGIQLTRQSIQEYADHLRRQEGVGIWAKKVVQKIPQEGDCVIDSIRNPGEVEVLRGMGNFYLIKVYAPAKLRFSRMIKRSREHDPKTFDEFQNLERKDLGIGQPEYGQQHAQCFALADKTIVNEGTIEKLREVLTEVVKELRVAKTD